MARGSDFLAMTPKQTMETKIDNGICPQQNHSVKETEPRDDPWVGENIYSSYSG